MRTQQLVKDWSKVNLHDPKSRKQLIGCVQHFFNQAYEQDFCGEFEAAMQHAATSGDFPTSVVQVLKKFQQVPYYDNAWESIFDMIDMTSSKRNSFEILDVEDGLTFEVVPEGDRAKIYKMAGTKATVSMDMYGAGLGWSRRLFDDEEYWNINNNAITFRNRWFDNRSTTAYALIDAVSSSQNLIWQAVTPASVAASNENYDAIRDFNTMNKAAETIFEAVKDKGYGINPTNTPFVVLYPLQLRGRITRAFGVQNKGISDGIKGLHYSFVPAMTTGLSDTSKYYVVLPGQKSCWGNRMNLTLFDQFDPKSYSDVAIGWGRYGGGIGDIEQYQRCATV